MNTSRSLQPQNHAATLPLSHAPHQRCAWTGFRIFWIRALAASNRIRRLVFLPVAGSELDFVLTEKTLLVVYFTDIQPDSNRSRILWIQLVPDPEWFRIQNLQNRIASGRKKIRVRTPLLHTATRQNRMKKANCKNFACARNLTQPCSHAKCYLVWDSHHKWKIVVHTPHII